MLGGSIKVTRLSRAPPRHLFGASPNVSCLLRLFFPDLLQATLFSLVLSAVAFAREFTLQDNTTMSEEEKTVCIRPDLQL